MAIEIKYPANMRSKHSPDLVVTFTEPRTGKVLFPDDRYHVGFMSDEWTPASNVDWWEEHIIARAEPSGKEVAEMLEEFGEIPIGKTPLKDAKIPGANDGSKNSFYDFPEWVTNIDTLAEYLQLDGYDFNVLKSLTVNLGERHAGTSKKRELNKRLHYSEMAIRKFKRS